jgi:glucuronoarabinoxylan endo-1,4-beta-xylanase
MLSRRNNYILASTVFIGLLNSVNIFGQTSTIDWTDVHQQIDGWGGEDWFGNSGVHQGFTLTSSQAATFFSPTTGIGLEYIRTGNYACPATAACAVSTSNVPDLVTLQEAVSNGAHVDVDFAPPANLKYVDSFSLSTPGANGTCIPNSNWSAYATFIVQWIQMLQANGVPVSAIGVANESDLNDTDGLGGCLWTGAGLDGFIAGNLGPALTAAGLSSVDVGMPQNYDWFDDDLYSACLDDSNCSKYVSIASGHGYAWEVGAPDGMGTGYCCHTATAPPSSTNGKRIWMTEVNGGFTYNSTYGMWSWDPSITDAMVWARSIHDYLTIANASAWFYWELVDWCGGINTGGCVDAPFNSGLTIASGATGGTPNNLTMAKRFYAVGNWSKFVRSGYYRIDSTTNPQPGVYVTAFQNTPSGTLVIVAVNTNGSNTSQSFTVTNAPSFSTVTPYVTSANLSLSAQATASLSSNEFTYALPAGSVTTFVGSSTLQPPTGLTAKAY